MSGGLKVGGRRRTLLGSMKNRRRGKNRFSITLALKVLQSTKAAAPRKNAMTNIKTESS